MTELNPIIVPSCPCPHCGRTLNAALEFSEPDSVPREGDVTVCMYCLGSAEYGPNGELIALEESKLNAEEAEDLAAARLVLASNAGNC